ncbi:MAG: lipoprotein-releasing system ATP-binding protein LolD, partial [Janthinobacterium sp.]
MTDLNKPASNGASADSAVLSCRGLGKTFTQGSYKVQVLAGI